MHAASISTEGAPGYDAPCPAHHPLSFRISMNTYMSYLSQGRVGLGVGRLRGPCHNHGGGQGAGRSMCLGDGHALAAIHVALHGQWQCIQSLSW